MKPAVSSRLQAAVRVVRLWAENRGMERLPEVGIVFGSGLARAAGVFEAVHELSYSRIPGLAACSAPGHQSRLTLGVLPAASGRPLPVAALLGRHHLYEGRTAEEAAFGVRLLGRLGVRRLVLTAAVGAIRPDLRVGDFVRIEDHLNLTGRSPLRGPEPGPESRFPDMTRAWDPELRRAFRRVAGRLGMRLPKGVYAGLPGPQFETPAEIRMLARLGGDVVGMSIVMEAIAARHLGLRLAGLAFCSNLAAGMSEQPLDAAHVTRAAAKAAPRLVRLLRGAADEPEIRGRR